MMMKIFNWIGNLFGRRPSLEERRAEGERAALSESYAVCKKHFPELPGIGEGRHLTWEYVRALGKTAGVPYWREHAVYVVRKIAGQYHYPEMLARIAEYLGYRHRGVKVHECCHFWLSLIGIHHHHHRLDGVVFGWADSRRLTGYMLLKHKMKCLCRRDMDMRHYHHRTIHPCSSASYVLEDAVDAGGARAEDKNKQGKKL